MQFATQSGIQQTHAHTHTRGAIFPRVHACMFVMIGEIRTEGLFSSFWWRNIIAAAYLVVGGWSARPVRGQGEEVWAVGEGGGVEWSGVASHACPTPVGMRVGLHLRERASGKLGE